MCIRDRSPAGTRTRDEDPAGVDPEFVGMLGRPRQAGVAVLDRRGVGVLGGEAVFHADDDGPRVDDVRKEQVDARASVADDHPAAVRVIDARGVRRTRGRAQHEQGDVRVAGRSGDGQLLDPDRATGGEVDRRQARYCLLYTSRCV